MKNLDAGMNKWRNLIMKHLGSDRKIFIEAGSDAHGDFNYRRYYRDEIDYNTSLGRPRTCCFMDSFSKSNVWSGLRGGSCFMTDGPALNLKVNGAGLGETVTVDTGSNVSVFVEWKSTSEFGTLSEIKVIKGVESLNDDSVEKTLNPNNYENSQLYTYSLGEDWLRIDEDSYFRVEGVTNTGKRVYTNPVWVDASDAPYIIVEAHDITSEDSASGGTCDEGGTECASDGSFNTDEDIRFDLRIKNIGKAYADTLRMNITSSSSCVDSLDRNTNILIGDVSAGSTSWVESIDLTTKADNEGTCDVGDYQDFDVTLWDTGGRIWKHTFTVRMDQPNWDAGGHQITDYYANMSINSDDTLFIAIDFDNNHLINDTTDKPVVYYKCGIASIDDGVLGYDGYDVMSDYMTGGWDWKAIFYGVSEKCEGKKLYWRARVKDTYWNTYFWSSSETIDFVGEVADEDTTPPSFGTLSDSGDNNPYLDYEFNVTLSDDSGVLDDSYYPLVYYSWDSETVNDTVYDGLIDLDEVAGVYTAKFNVSEMYENKTIYWRAYAGDADNSPAYAWSSVQTGGTIAGIPPSTPELNNFTSATTYTVDWSEAVDGSGVKQYELNETFDGASQVYTANYSYKNFTGKDLGSYTYSVRAQDNPGNWGNWSTPITVNVACTGSDPSSSLNWNISEDTHCVNCDITLDEGGNTIIESSKKLTLENATLTLDSIDGGDSYIFFDGFLRIMDNTKDTTIKIIT